ncbi:MAG: tetratricopeptide repeat protein, partial [Imperialibacter sp.]
MRNTCLGLVLGLFFLAGCSVSKKAEKSYANAEYDVAIDQYQTLVRKNPRDPDLNYRLAEAYKKSNKIGQGAPYYRAAIQNGIDDEMAWFEYAQALKAVGKYDDAKDALNDYLLKASTPSIKKLAEDDLASLEKLDLLKDRESYYRVKNLETVNTPAAEY